MTLADRCSKACLSRQIIPHFGIHFQGAMEIWFVPMAVLLLTI